jgi:pimeloyl-ACP methyl ester carboxylesterase
MRHFILVHGAWHEPSCWKELKTYLETHGQVYTPNLIPLKPYQEICLNDYAQSIEKLINEINQPVILIGHSFAGIVISEVANHLPNKIAELIYINALIPLEQESLFSLSACFEYQNLSPYLQIHAEYQSIDIEPNQKAIDYMYQCKPPSALQLRREPLHPFSESISSLTYQNVSRKAIICQKDLTISANDQIKMCERQNIPYELMDADHCPFHSQPNILSQLILKGCLDVSNDF